MLLRLADRGRLDLISAWLDGILQLSRLAEADESGKIFELSKALQREREGDGANITLRRAIRECLELKEDDVAPKTLKRYQEGLAHFQRHVDPTRFSQTH